MEFAKKFNFEEKEEKQSQPFENYELLKNPSLFCETDLGVNKKIKKDINNGSGLRQGSPLRS